MRSRSKALLVAAILVCSGTAHAQSISDENPFGIGLSTGVLGTGIDVSYAYTDRFSLRANANYGRYEFPEILSLATNIAGIPYDYDLRLLTVGLLADYEVFSSRRPGNSVTLTGGVYYNENRFGLTATPFSGNLTIGGTSYTPAQVGTLTADLDLERRFSPYIGVGAETNFFTGLPISVFSRAGLLFQGNIDATVAASGGGVSGADLAAEQADLEDSLGFLEVLPVFWIGATVRF